MAPWMEKRQNSDRIDNSDDDWWWYSGTAVAVKWAILAGIFLLCLAFFLGSYLHAQRRIKKGLPPLAYHRWLLPRRQRALFEPHLAQPQLYRPAEGYYMNQYPPPPPAYSPDDATLPKYVPPEGSSKVNPDQTMRQGEPSNTGPTAPPPSHVTQ